VKAFLLIWWLFMWSTPVYETNYKIADLRKQYELSTKDKDTGEKFYNQMMSYKDNNPVVLGYKAASFAVMAKYAWAPYSKLKFLRQSAATFNTAVAMDNGNPEIRFLRYTIENYIPRYLEMSAHVEEDKALVLQHLLNYPNCAFDAEGFKVIRGFMLKGDHCTEQQKKQLMQIKI
jgi:hypothetical protein